MFAVLVVVQGLAVTRAVRAVFALKEGKWRALFARVLEQHVLTKFILAFTSVRTDLAYERLGLMPELVAVKLVSPVTTVRALVTFIPKVTSMFAHVHIQVVLPLGDVSTLGTHMVLVV